MSTKHTPKPLADLEAVAYKLQRERNVALEQRDALLALLHDLAAMDYTIPPSVRARISAAIAACEVQA